MTAKSDEVEADRYVKAQDEGAILTNFYDWLLERYMLCEQHPTCSTVIIPAAVPPPESLFAEYFGIDLKAVERHRKRLLEPLQTESQDRGGS